MRAPIFQPIPPNQYHLIDDQIDIWQFSLLQMPTMAASLLNEDEKIRAERFHFFHHSRRFTVARAMMRKILACYLHEDPKILTFSYNKHGKPSINHPLEIEFNLSHSGELALLAVGKTAPLGIDVEQFSERPFADIGEKMFSKDEIAILAKEPESLKSVAFFNIWSQKEAFIKACGLGLAYPTETFTVSLSDVPYRLCDHQTEIWWNMLSFMPDKNAAAALCFNPKVTLLRKIILDPMEFIYA